MSDTPSARDADPPLPEITGYKLSRVIGNGGMSTVYLGTQLSLGREVAIKVMLPEALADEVSRHRFENEVRTIARLEHPHIVGIYEVGRTSQGLPYYAMPFLPRGHLGQREFANDGLEHGHARIRTILQELLAALDYAHARGVVHRDVKAENVLFDEAGRPLLADFGIALRRGFGTRVTSAGLAVGSTAYMAPEQARGEQVDPRADLYSVGVLAFEMLTGRLPFVAGDALSMAVKHAQDPIPRLPMPLRHWQRFIDNALAKSPKQRYRSAPHMRAGLDRVPSRRRSPAIGMLHGLRAGIAAMRRWPKAVWVCIVLVVAMGLGTALRHLPRQSADRFFRVPQAEHFDQSTRDTAAPRSFLDAAEAMLRPLPESPAERWIAAANEQLDNNNLTAPANDNAYDSLLAAWQADPGHPGLPAASTTVIAALGDQAAEKLAAGADARANGYLESAANLASLAGQTGGQAMIELHGRLAVALGTRMDRAEADFDRPAASRTVAQARAMGAGAAVVAALQARARNLARASVQTGKRNEPVAISPLAVTREDYARFVTATRRPATLCRERTSLLRIVKPISWQSPGFTQTPQQPVVCVSWSDADAYIRWLGQQQGQRYRLPTAAEARRLPAAAATRPVAEWLRECSKHCRQHMSTGQSWRGPTKPRSLDANRGYDDVGFRLVREL